MTDPQEIINNIGILGILIMIIWKLLDRFVFTPAKTSKNEQGIDVLSDRIYKLETNHIVHLQADIDEIKGDMKDIRKEVNAVSTKVSVLESKLDNKVCN